MLFASAPADFVLAIRTIFFEGNYAIASKAQGGILRLHNATRVISSAAPLGNFPQTARQPVTCLSDFRVNFSLVASVKKFAKTFSLQRGGGLDATI